MQCRRRARAVESVLTPGGSHQGKGRVIYDCAPMTARRKLASGPTVATGEMSYRVLASSIVLERGQVLVLQPMHGSMAITSVRSRVSDGAISVDSTELMSIPALPAVNGREGIHASRNPGGLDSEPTLEQLRLVKRE